MKTRAKAKLPTESKSQTECVRRAISLPPRIHKAALAQAAKQNRNFSNYIQSLILRDAKSAEAGATAA